MVGFKNFLLATSLLLGWVAAAPALEAEAPGFSVFDKRAIFEADNAAQICENDYVLKAAIDKNGGASVVDLSGCTALFFYTGNTLISAFHIFCGNEKADGKTAAARSQKADYVVVCTAKVSNYNDASAGITEGNSKVLVGPRTPYSADNLNGKTIAISVKAGSRDTTQVTQNKVCPGEAGKRKL